MVYELIAGGTFLVGVDEDSRRCYVGARWKGIYFDEPAEAVDEAIRKWNSHGGHIVISRADLDYLELKRESDEPVLDFEEEVEIDGCPN